MIKAILYTTNTGYTEQYARMLSERTGLMCFPLSDASGHVGKGEEIIYLGWIMGGSIKNYKKAAKKYKIKAVIGVGLGATGSALLPS